MMEQNNLEHSEQVRDMQVLVKFTIYCEEVLQLAQRGLLNGLEASGSVLGFKRAIDEVLDIDILEPLYKEFSVALLGDSKDRVVAREYFRETARLYKEHGDF